MASVSLWVLRHTAVGDLRHSIVDSYVTLLELVSSTDTETDTAGNARGGVGSDGAAGRRPSARRFLCPETPAGTMWLPERC